MDSTSVILERGSKARYIYAVFLRIRLLLTAKLENHEPIAKMRR